MDIFEIIKCERFIALTRHVNVDVMEELVKALYEGGIRVLEITFNPSDNNTLTKTAACIAKAVESDMLVGAGTVLNTVMVEAAHKAGAKFIVSPNTDAEVIKRTKELDMLSMPGAYTPCEIVRAHELGADLVKIFPVLPQQVDYVKVVSGPLSHIKFMVTGGINPETAPIFLEAGATVVAAGASIIKPELVHDRKWQEITKLAAAHIKAIKDGVKNV
jgi:2-dehydro-3-deoxyphosphogluconate aldolase / (4S)-4-hydroxy-2-oxoglutarate aldolase